MTIASGIRDGVSVIIGLSLSTWTIACGFNGLAWLDNAQIIGKWLLINYIKLSAVASLRSRLSSGQ